MGKQSLVKIKVGIKESLLLDVLLEHIEDTENSDLILKITEWLVSELDSWGGGMAEDVNILKVIELLKKCK